MNNIQLIKDFYNITDFSTDILNWSFESDFNESEITIGYSAYQKIKCTYEQSGKIHRYIPDFYIESKNLVIEVKSNYTYTFADPKKRKSVKEKGINFIYAIVDIQNNNILFKRYE